MLLETASGMAALWAHMRRSVGACHRFSASVWARVGLRDVPASFAPSISAPLMIFVPPGLVVILGTSRARFRRQGDSRNNGMGHAAHDAAYRCSCGWSAATAIRPAMPARSCAHCRANGGHGRPHGRGSRHDPSRPTRHRLSRARSGRINTGAAGRGNNGGTIRAGPTALSLLSLGAV